MLIFYNYYFIYPKYINIKLDQKQIMPHDVYFWKVLQIWSMILDNVHQQAFLKCTTGSKNKRPLMKMLQCCIVFITNYQQNLCESLKYLHKSNEAFIMDSKCLCKTWQSMFEQILLYVFWTHASMEEVRLKENQSIHPSI